MTTHKYYNEYHQPIGEAVDTHHASLPFASRLQGTSCLLERFDFDRHFAKICDCYLQHTDTKDWTYLPVEAPTCKADVRALLARFDPAQGFYCYVILDVAGQMVLGTVCLMRADTVNRSIEMGWVIYSNRMKRTTMATEAQFLLMRYVFEDLHFRRYEWKCDSLNAPSRHAAERLGFCHEGTFRNAVIYKGRSRDTLWFSMIDTEWTKQKSLFEQYLSPSNFDDNGQQIKRLGDF